MFIGKSKRIGVSFLAITLSACAGLDFGNEGLTYYEPTPYLFVSINKDCTYIASVKSLPGKKKTVKFDRGYGSANLSLDLADGVITKVGQNTDSKVPESVKEFAGAITALSIKDVNTTTMCDAKAILIPIVDGIPQTEKYFNLPLEAKTVPIPPKEK